MEVHILYRTQMLLYTAIMCQKLFENNIPKLNLQKALARLGFEPNAKILFLPKMSHAELKSVNESWD